MKKILAVLAMLAVAGCASNEPAKSGSVSGGHRSTTAYSNINCNGCAPVSYTVKTPVEVIYKNDTYTTVYEPKTYKKTSYERKPYDCVKSDLCK